MKPFVRMAVCPVKKKYSTREILELIRAESSSKFKNAFLQVFRERFTEFRAIFLKP